MKATWAVAAATLLLAPASWSQSSADSSEKAHLGIDRVGSYLSYTWVDHAHGGWDLGAELDIGSVITPAAHLVVGANYLHAEADRPGSIGPELESSFHDFSLTADLRLALFRWHRLEPFAGAGAGVHFLGNDIAGDGTLRDRYSGTKPGAQFFGGTSLDLTSDRTWSGYLELRRMEVPHVGRTTLRLGVFVRI